MEGPAVSQPNFFEMMMGFEETLSSSSTGGKMIPRLSLSELINLSETRSDWSREIRNRLNDLAILYNVPYAKSIQELGLNLWISANRNLKDACERGDHRMIDVALGKDAVKLSNAAYHAAKNGNFSIMEEMLELGANPGKIVKGLIKGKYTDELLLFLNRTGITLSTEHMNQIRAYGAQDMMFMVTNKHHLNDEAKDLFEKYGLPNDLWAYTEYKIANFITKWNKIRYTHVFSDEPHLVMGKTRFDDQEEKIFYGFISTIPIIGENKYLINYIPFPDKTLIGSILEVLQYVFAKFLPERFREISWPVILPKCVMYCYKHIKHIDLLLDEYHVETERFIKIWHIFSALYYLQFDFLDSLDFQPEMLTVVEASILAVKHPLIMKILETRIDLRTAFYQALISDRKRMGLYLLDSLGEEGKYFYYGIMNITIRAESLECWNTFVPIIFLVGEEDIVETPQELIFFKILFEKQYINEELAEETIRNISYSDPHNPIIKFLREKGY